MDLRHPLFERVIVLADAGLLRLLTTDITIREVNHCIESDLAKEFVKHQQQYLRFIRKMDLDDEPAAIPESDAADKLKAAFAEFLQKANALTLSTAKLPAGPVLDAFFELRPPFSEKKRCEFRDAFVSEALRAHSEPVHVVSQDGDFDKISPRFTVHKSLADYLSMHHADTTSSAEVTAKVRAFVEERRDQLMADFLAFDFELEGYERGEYSADAIPEDVEIVSITLISPPPSVVAQVMLDYVYQVDATFPNPKYDSDIGEESHVSARFQRKLRVEAEAIGVLNAGATRISRGRMLVTDLDGPVQVKLPRKFR